jgi:hypothetical protein
MSTVITLVNSDYEVFYSQTSPNTAMILTALGHKRADTLVDCTQASYQVNGQDANGHVLYTAKYGGLCGNGVRVRHVVGGTGPGYESRALAVAVIGRDVTVTFGTNGGGVSVVPTATQVAAVIAGSSDAMALLSAAAQGTGAGLAGETSYENLQNGADDGDSLKFLGNPNVCRRINLRETT